MCNLLCRSFRTALVGFLSALACATATGAPVILFDNTDQPPSGVELAYNTPFQGQRQIAQAFNTDNFSYVLLSIDLVPGSIEPGFPGIDPLAVLDIYENGFGPSHYVATLTQAGGAFGGQGLLLNPQSAYWVVLNSDNESGWEWTSSSNGAGVGYTPVWMLGVDFMSADVDTPWPILASGDPLMDAPMMMLVVGNRIPEPATVALCVLLLAGLAYGTRRSRGT